MAERYLRIYTLPETDLYETGSSLLICAGALLKDTQTGRIIAQLKFRNIGAKRIKAVRASVRAFDPFGTELEGVPEFQYLDLSADRDAEFGQKTAIVLPNADTRSFACTCSGVIFADNTVWTTGTEDWRPLIRQKTLSEQFGDLADQYRRDTFKDAKYMPAADRDLWRCACGAINRDDESICHGCRMKRSELEEAADVGQLKEHDEAYRRQLAEQAEAARIEAERKAEEARLEAERRAEEERIAKEQAAKKRKKTLAIVLPIVAVVTAIAILLPTVILPTIRYNEAKKLYEAGKYEKAIVAFEALNGYRDSETQIDICKTAIKECEYDAAVALYNSGKYEEAIAAFEAISGYKDSQAQIEKCVAAINDPKYDAAVTLYNIGKYEEAIAAFEALNGYRDSAAQIEACETAINDQDYDAALELYNDGQYEKAIAAFEALNGYRDSTAKIKELYSLKAKVGSYVFFGTYEQDNNTSNGKEDIEWLVLAKEGDRVLVISRYAIDCQQYNYPNREVTWETCSLRKWLSGTFINNAFSSNEQAMIRSTTVTADKNPSYNTSPGNNTTDKVFLLSITEVNKYFSSDEARKCAATDYAIAQGAWTCDSYKADGRATCWWWLRSPGIYSNCAAAVNYDGSVINYGNNVNYDSYAVRPALWIDLG